MSTTVTGVVSHFPEAQNGFTTTLASTIAGGATTVPLNSVAGYTNGRAVVFVVDPTDAVKKQTFTGIMDTAGVQVTSVVWTSGTNQTHTGGATVVDYTTATHNNMITKGLKVQHKDTGAHGDVTSDSIVNSGTITSIGAVITDTVSEKTATNGVDIDGLKIKDSKLATDNSVVTANITDANVTLAKIANPYKFRVTRTSNQTGITDATLTVADFDSETFDPNNNFDLTTNQYTIPVTGYYQLNALARATGAGIVTFGLYIYGGAAGTSVLSKCVTAQASANEASAAIADLQYCTAGDLISLKVYIDVTSSTGTLIGSASELCLTGHLVSV